MKKLRKTEMKKEEAVIFGMSLPGGYISSQGNHSIRRNACLFFFTSSFLCQFQCFLFSETPNYQENELLIEVGLEPEIEEPLESKRSKSRFFVVLSFFIMEFPWPISISPMSSLAVTFSCSLI